MEKNMNYIEVNGIKSVAKKFDPKSHAIYDKAKYKVIDYYNKLGFNAVENTNIHGVDLIVNDKDNYFYCEVEVKNNWQGHTFNFPDIYVLSRKKKYFNLQKPTVMFMLNHQWNRGLLLNSKDILDCPLREVKNKKVKNGEYFFIVPVEKAKFVNL